MQIVVPSFRAAVSNLGRDAAVDQSQQRAVAVGGERDLDHAGGGRGRGVPHPCPCEDHAMGRSDLDVLSARDVPPSRHIHAEVAAGASIELGTPAARSDEGSLDAEAPRLPSGAFPACPERSQSITYPSSYEWERLVAEPVATERPGARRGTSGGGAGFLGQGPPLALGGET